MPRKNKQLAKLTRPRLHNAVHRERLFAKLDSARESRPAICVVGPPGAGKTTLMASWLDARGIDGIWYQIDPNDGDLATFFYYLGEAAKPFNRKGQPLLAALTPEYFHDVPGFSRRFFRELFKRLPTESALVLDNYQEVSPEQNFHEIVAEAVAEVPEGVTLVCISRRDPPDCYARLIANEAVAFVNSDDLKLSLEETRAIILGKVDTGTVRDLHARSGGWAAGVVLMLENLKAGTDKRDGATETPQTLFSYFGAQIFERVPGEVRDFLLATADLPWVEPELAGLLSGNSNANHILEDLCRRHLFTHRRASGNLSYQYHAMFQEFLRARADAALPSVVRARRRTLAAEFFERNGNVAEAFGLYRDAQAWGEASTLVTNIAQDLVSQGRFRTLSEWIDALPGTVVAEKPWLSYWHGRALVPFDPTGGRKHLEQAYHGFKQRLDVAGEVAAAASIVEAIYIENRSCIEMDSWIETLERGLKIPEGLSSPAMQLRVYSSALIAMLYRQPGNSLMPLCLDRLMSLIELEGDSNTRVSAAIGVLTYASASGDFPLGHRTRALVEPVVDNAEVALAQRFLWRVWLGYFLMMLGEYAQAEENYRMAEELNSEGQFPWSANLVFCRALGKMSGGNLADALVGFDAMETVTNRSRPQDLGYLHVARAWKGMIIDDPVMARHESEAALAFAERIENFSLTVVWQAPRIWALALTGQHEEFLRSMDQALRAVDNTCYRRPHVEWLAMKAWLHLRRGELEAAREALSEALPLARNLGHGAYFDRLCRFAPELRAFTIASGIDVEFVHYMARKFNWPAPSPEIEDWPWPVRVYTLGAFSICVEGRTLSFTHKAPKKPISLLKAIIALGEREVPQDRLIDALWPEEEGGAAHHAFSLAMHRLRRLLGRGDTITVENGFVSLDWNQVWTDSRTFDAVADDDRRNADLGEAKIMNLYRGNFLAGEPEAPWSASRRERLRVKFLYVVERHGHKLENAARLDDAITVYVRGLDAEPLAEAFYQGLMRCYAAQGKQNEALTTYRRLKQTLSVVLGRQPSALTVGLAQRIGEHQA